MTSSYHQHLAQIRQKYTKASQPWTEEEEALLQERWLAGWSIADLSNLLQRRPGAIHSRLQKMKMPGWYLATVPLSEEEHILVYNTSETKNSSSSCEINIRAEWQPVYSAAGQEYEFPAVITEWMIKHYNLPVLYRWVVYQSRGQLPYALYIGSTRQLCPDRLEGYLNPKDSNTNRRLHQQLLAFQESAMTVRLEILSQGTLQVDGCALSVLDCTHQADRLFVEKLLSNYYRLQGHRMLNL